MLRELLRRIGQHLMLVRIEKGLHMRDIGNPSDKIVKKIDAGQAVKLETIEAYAQALGLSLGDVLRSVLVEPSQRLSPEAAALLRRFDMMSIRQRYILQTMAEELTASATLPTLNQPHAVRQG